jgi:hypothetical protein
MKVIQVIQSKTSELNPEFNSVKSIEIDDNSFDSGALDYLIKMGLIF